MYPKPHNLAEAHSWIWYTARMTDTMVQPEKREATWRFRVAYVGARFSGWQYQDNVRTVQGAIQEALQHITGEQILVQGAGRTDADVHAFGQVASCKLTSRLDSRKFVLALNTFLPPDVSIMDAQETFKSFNAKTESLGKRYVYRILNQTARNPFLHETTWHQRGQLDLKAMQVAALHFVGEHNFDSFRSSQCSSAHAKRYIWRSQILAPDANGVIQFEVRGNAFCQHMVRIMAGTLVDVGRNRFQADDIPHIIKARDRKRAGITAPGKGLTLEQVYYPDQIQEAQIPHTASFPRFPPNDATRKAYCLNPEI
jgi:tRNA pseudouridine38-40 synthase